MQEHLSEIQKGATQNISISETGHPAPFPAARTIHLYSCKIKQYSLAGQIVLDYHMRNADGDVLVQGQVTPSVDGLTEMFMKLEAHTIHPIPDYLITNRLIKIMY